MFLKVVCCLPGFEKFKKKGKQASKDEKEEKAEVPVTEEPKVDPEKDQKEPKIEDKKADAGFVFNFGSGNKDGKKESYFQTPPPDKTNYLPIAIFLASGLAFYYYSEKKGIFSGKLTYKVA